MLHLFLQLRQPEAPACRLVLTGYGSRSPTHDDEFGGEEGDEEEGEGEEEGGGDDAVPLSAAAPVGGVAVQTAIKGTLGRAPSV